MSRRVSDVPGILMKSNEQEPSEPHRITTLAVKGDAAENVAPVAGGYVVQVSSQKSEADAQASYRALQGKYPSVLGVDLGKKGVYYRTFAGPFSSVDQATQVCNRLSAAGGPHCLIQKELTAVP
jgi:cell division septation protein DedD